MVKEGKKSKPPAAKDGALGTQIYKKILYRQIFLSSKPF